jgi:hypothetical protein
MDAGKMEFLQDFPIKEAGEKIPKVGQKVPHKKELFPSWKRLLFSCPCGVLCGFLVFEPHSLKSRNYVESSGKTKSPLESQWI